MHGNLALINTYKVTENNENHKIKSMEWHQQLKIKKKIRYADNNRQPFEQPLGYTLWNFYFEQINCEM